jgi:hypothetical protein
MKRRPQRRLLDRGASAALPPAHRRLRVSPPDDPRGGAAAEQPIAAFGDETLDRAAKTVRRFRTRLAHAEAILVVTNLSKFHQCVEIDQGVRRAGARGAGKPERVSGDKHQPVSVDPRTSWLPVACAGAGAPGTGPRGLLCPSWAGARGTPWSPDGTAAPWRSSRQAICGSRLGSWSTGDASCRPPLSRRDVTGAKQSSGPAALLQGMGGQGPRAGSLPSDDYVNAGMLGVARSLATSGSIEWHEASVICYGITR